MSTKLGDQHEPDNVRAKAYQLNRSVFSLYSTSFLAQMLTALGYDGVLDVETERESIMGLLHDELPTEKMVAWIEENAEYVYAADSWGDDPDASLGAETSVFLSPQRSEKSFMRSLNDGYCQHIPMLSNDLMTIVGFTPVSVNLAKPHEFQVSKNVFSYIDERMQPWLCDVVQVRNNGQILECKTKQYRPQPYVKTTDAEEEVLFTMDYMLRQIQKENKKTV